MNDYIDGSLTLEEITLVEAHLDSCHGCAAEYEFMKNMIVELSSIDEIAIPDTLHHDIMKRIHQETPVKHPYRWIKPITSIVAAAFLLFVVFSVISGNDILQLNKTNEDTIMATDNSADGATGTHSPFEVATKADRDQEERFSDEVTSSDAASDMAQAPMMDTEVSESTMITTEDAAPMPVPDGTTETDEGDTITVDDVGTTDATAEEPSDANDAIMVGGVNPPVSEEKSDNALSVEYGDDSLDEHVVYSEELETFDDTKSQSVLDIVIYILIGFGVVLIGIIIYRLFFHNKST